MVKEELDVLSVKISKKLKQEWYSTIIKNSKAPVRKRLEEALKEDIKRHKLNKGSVL